MEVVATPATTRSAARVTDRLTTRDRQLAAWFKREGFLRPLLTVAALRKANIKPQTAAALLSKETANGSNVFGCDHGPCGDAPPYCRQNVTERRAKRLRDSNFSNGVGPTQLTFEGYIDRARRAGGEWQPYVNGLRGTLRRRRLTPAAKGRPPGRRWRRTAEAPPEAVD